MHYLGDFATGKTIAIHFTTHDDTGAPVAPSAALAAADFRIYKNGSATERSSTAGATVTSPFDGTVGRHLITIDTANNTDPGFYAAGNDYRVELNTAKTIGGVSQSGVVVGTFSLENRYVPTVLDAAGIRSALGMGSANLDTQLGGLPAGVWANGTRTLTSGAGLDAAGIRAALGMGSANLDTQLAGLPASIEAAIINDGDATALLQAIADKIATENPSLGDLTLAAIAAAVWANATRTLTSGGGGGSLTAADVWEYEERTLTSGSGGGGLDAAGVRAALGMASANLDSQLGSLPAGVWANGTRTLTAGVTLTSGERSALVTAIDVGLTASHGDGSWVVNDGEGGLSPEDLAAIAEQTSSLVIASFASSQILLTDLGRFVTASEINLRQGDDYRASKGTAWEKTISLAGYDFTAAGLTVRFGAGNVPGQPLITGSASLHDKAVGSVKLRLEFDRNDTKAIPQASYQWDAEVVDSAGDVLTIDGGMLHLQASWTTLT